MIFWKDFALDPILGALLNDEIFEGEMHGFALMEEGSVALQETRRFNSSARMVETLNKHGLDLAATLGKEASTVVRSSSSERPVLQETVSPRGVG